MTKKILIITPKFYPSIWWIEEQVKLLWKNFTEKWYKVDILTNNFDNLKSKEKIFWLNIFRFSNIFWFFIFLLKNKNYELIISRQYYKNSFILWLLKFLSLIKSKTVICTDSWWKNDEINNIKKKLLIFQLYKIYFYIIWQNNFLNCLNQDNINHLNLIYKWKFKYLNKITNIYNWIDISNYKKNDIKNIKNILYLWRFEKEKWIFETIKAFNKINNNNIILNLVWYWNKNIELKIKNLIKNNNRIIFHWKKYWIEKENIINNTDLFIFPTYYPEWQPVTLTEIAFKNIPIITTDIANNKEIYWDNLIYVKKENINDLKEKIELIINNIKNYKYNYLFSLKKIDINNITNQFLNLK